MTNLNDIITAANVMIDRVNVERKLNLKKVGTGTEILEESIMRLAGLDIPPNPEKITFGNSTPQNIVLQAAPPVIAKKIRNYLDKEFPGIVTLDNGNPTRLVFDNDRFLTEVLPAIEKKSIPIIANNPVLAKDYGERGSGSSRLLGILDENERLPEAIERQMVLNPRDQITVTDHGYELSGGVGGTLFDFNGNETGRMRC